MTFLSLNQDESEPCIVQLLQSFPSAGMALLYATPALLLMIIVSCSRADCHRMEAAFENMLDEGPMERPGYFEEAYSGSDRGYSKVGIPFNRQLPIPKLIIRRKYIRSHNQGSRSLADLSQAGPKMRALFDFVPGNLPLDLMTRRMLNINNFAPSFTMKGDRIQNQERNGGFQIMMAGRPALGMNYNMNNNEQNAGSMTGSGSVRDDVDQTGVEMSPVRANGW